MYSEDPQICNADQAGKADKAKGRALFQRELFISYCDVRSFNIVIEIGVLIISISLVFGYDKAKVKTRQRSYARLTRASIGPVGGISMCLAGLPLFVFVGA